MSKIDLKNDSRIAGFMKLDAHRMVFVDGVYDASLSHVGELLNENLFVSLEKELIEKNKLDDYINVTTLSNDSFGSVVHLKENIKIEKPLLLLFIHASKTKEDFNIRNLFVLEKGSSATIVEAHVSLDEALTYTQKSKTSFYAKENAKCEYIKIQNENLNVKHEAGSDFNLETSSGFNYYPLVLNCGVSKIELNAKLNEMASEFSLKGFSLLHNSGQNSVDIVIDHKGVKSISDVLYKGVLYDQAKSAISGRVLVQDGALGSKADLQNHNLLLSDEAKAFMQPELEVYVDDVKASHGATSGSLDEKAIFYLKSRGIDDVSAKKLLLDAFIKEVWQEIELDNLRDLVESLI